jgi:hypothetical protein
MHTADGRWLESTAMVVTDRAHQLVPHVVFPIGIDYVAGCISHHDQILLNLGAPRRGPSLSADFIGKTQKCDADYRP